MLRLVVVGGGGAVMGDVGCRPGAELLSMKITGCGFRQSKCSIN